MDTTFNRVFRALYTAGAVYALVVIFNIVLGAYAWFPRYEWLWLFIPAPESAAALLILLAIGFQLNKIQKLKNIEHAHSSHKKVFRFPASMRFLLILYTVIILILAFFSVAEAFFQHIYLRTFDIRANLPLVSHFFNMILGTEIFSQKAMLIVPSTAMCGLFGILLWCFFSRIAPIFGRMRQKPTLISATILFLVSMLISPVEPAAIRFIDQMLFYDDRNTSELYTTKVPVFDQTSSYGGYIEKTKERYAFPGIQDSNLHLCIVESYGTTVFTNSHHFQRLQAFYQQQNMLLDKAGFSILSYAYNSTTFGGTSWLADATMLSGVEIRTQAQYDQIVKGSTPNLLHLLKQSKYHTILSAPGSKFMTDEYTGFYAYDRYILHEDFMYDGPFFTFGELPDQYQLYYIFKHEIGHNEPSPYFVEYILCSSHVPWNYIPPYIESWKNFNQGRIYFNRSRNTWYDNSWALGSELFEGYAHSIRYSLESVFGYARTFLDEDDILIIIGDHQPKFPVSEKEAGFGVPVHVIAKQRSSILPFLRMGYENGILPPCTDNLVGLEHFLDHLLTVAEGRYLRPRPENAPLPIPK